MDNFKNIIKKIIIDYPNIRKKIFKNHCFANYLRNEVPNLLNEQLALSDVYNIKSSPGNGSWAWIPWIAVFNKTITDSVTSGIFLVYLFSADCSGVYLSLTQGSASKKKIYGLPGSREFLRSQASLLRNLEKTKIALDPSRDFMVLYSNCHRMIHRIKPIPSLEEFKRIIKI